MLRSTARKQRSTFPFLDLPGELRNIIYAYYFARGYDSVNDCFDRRRDRITRRSGARLIRPNVVTPTILLVCKDMYYEAVAILRQKTLTFCHGLYSLDSLDSLVGQLTLKCVTSLVVTDIGHRPLDKAWLRHSFDGHRRLVLGLASIYSNPGHRLKQVELQFLDEGLHAHVLGCWDRSTGCDMRQWVIQVFLAWRAVRGVQKVTVLGWMPDGLAHELVRLMQSNFNPILTLPLGLRQEIYTLATLSDNDNDVAEQPTSRLYTPSVLLMDQRTSKEARAVLADVPLSLDFRIPGTSNTSILDFTTVETLQNLKRLNICIRHWKFVSTVVPDLMAILAQRHKLQRLRFHLEGLETENLYCINIAWALRPLTELRGINRVSITGQIPRRLAHTLKSYMQLPKRGSA